MFGGGPNDDLGGLYYRPTLFADAPAGAEILTQRGLRPGPHAAARSPTRTRRVALANDTDYGLAAIVYTGDPGRAERVSRAAGRRHRVGQLLLRARPGARRSAARATRGIGREGGAWSFDFYADVKNVCTAPWTA